MVHVGAKWTGPNQWENFKVSLRNEFVPQNSERRNRDKLRVLRQTASVAGYLTAFRNLVIAIPGMNEAEKLDRFYCWTQK